MENVGSARRRNPSEKRIRIKVLGVGGAGVNALDRLVEDGFEEVSLHAINTDAQALAHSMVPEKLQIGEKITHGLGAGGDPLMGQQAAIENLDHLRDMVKGYDLIFVAAGMGGGTGTGAGPVVAKVARNEGALALALVTLPFTHEGQHRMEVAMDGLAAMQSAADAVICIPNDRLLSLANETASVLEAFRPTDEFLSCGVRKIWQMLSRTGLINIDFADLRSVLRRRSGETLIGFGDGEGANKVEMALEKALEGPLLSDKKLLSRAESVLVTVTHGTDFTMNQLKQLMGEIHQRVGPRAACKQGIVVDENYSDRLSVLIIASTGQVLDDEKVTPEKKSATGSDGNTIEKGDVAKPYLPQGNATFFPDLSDDSKKKSSAVEKNLQSAVSKQETLKLDQVTRGLFERVEKTMVHGEDLDRPTFIRRGIVLKG